MADADISQKTEREGSVPVLTSESAYLAFAIVLAKNRKIILGLPLIVGFLTTGVSLLVPNNYTARALMMPPQQQHSNSAMMLGQLSALAGMTGGNLSLKSPSELYVGILKSRTISDALISKFELKELYEKDTLVETREKLADHTFIASGKDGLIAIEVTDRDGQRAADMANGYIEELSRLTANLAISEAAQRRFFFEQQLRKVKEELANAELSLKEVQERTGLIQIDQQGRAMLEAVATLRAQIVAREVELASMKAYATDTNPDIVKLNQEITTLRRELSEAERGGGDAKGLIVPTGKMAAAGLEYVRKLRDLKYSETMFELLAKQYELARVDEARDAVLVQKIDSAIKPDKKSGPKRLLIVLIAVVTAGLVACLIAFIKEAREAMSANSGIEKQYQYLWSLIKGSGKVQMRES